MSLLAGEGEGAAATTESSAAGEASEEAVEAEEILTRLNSTEDTLSVEEREELVNRYNELQVRITLKTILKATETGSVTTGSVTAEDLQTLNQLATKLSNTDVVTDIDQTVAELPAGAGARLDASMRPFFENMTAEIKSLIEKTSGKEQLAKMEDLEAKVTQAIRARNPVAYKNSTAAVDSFIDNELDDSTTALKEKTAGRGNLKNFSRVFSFLKIAGIFGIIGLLAILAKSNNGCWKWDGGAKTQKINDFDFTKDDNRKFCACSDTNNFETPQPLSSWCPSGVSDGSPTYVTCPPYQYPVCTIKTDSSGIYYSFYIATPLSEFNSMVNQTGKIIRNSNNLFNFRGIIKDVVVVISLFLSLYFIYKIFVEDRLIYGIGLLFVIVVFIGSWSFI